MREAAGGLEVMLMVAADAGLRHFRRGAKIVVDILADASDGKPRTARTVAARPPDDEAATKADPTSLARRTAADMALLEATEDDDEADVVERESAAFVFSEGDDDPLAAMHMYRGLQRRDDVANACEMAANAFLPIVLG